MTKRHNIYMLTEWWAKIDKEAKRLGVTRSNMLRVMVSQYFESVATNK